MTDKNFMRVEDVARELDVSKSYAYKIVQKLNKELEAKGLHHHHRQSEQTILPRKDLLRRFC